jgi:cobalt-zinc-cadmium efflux system protein
MAALINALILIAATGIIAYESILKLIHPVVVDEKIIIIVAAIGILINGGTALLFMRGRKEDLNIKGAFLHLAYDALIAFGVVIAGFIILFTHSLWIDPLVGLFIVIAIVAGTWSLLVDSVNLILDAVPRSIDHQSVRDYLGSIGGVVAVHDLHIWGLSTNEIALTAHLVIPERNLHDADFASIKYDLKYQFKISHVTLQVEKGTTADPCGQVQTC